VSEDVPGRYQSSCVMDEPRCEAPRIGQYFHFAFYCSAVVIFARLLGTICQYYFRFLFSSKKGFWKTKWVELKAN